RRERSGRGTPKVTSVTTGDDTGHCGSGKSTERPTFARPASARLMRTHQADDGAPFGRRAAPPRPLLQAELRQDLRVLLFHREDLVAGLAVGGDGRPV